MSSSPNRNIALLVDYENVVQSAAVGLQAILQQTTREGTVVLRRAYGNWAHFSSHKQRLWDAGFELIDVASRGGKNSVDIKLVVDAMEIAFTKDYIDTFVIVSRDSDFIHLVVKLNELNRRAWLCLGDKQPSPALAKFCFRMPTPSKTSLPVGTKIGPTIPKTTPVPSLAKLSSVTLSPSQLELIRVAVQICDQTVLPPMPLAWLFATVRVLDPSFDTTRCVGKGKRANVRLAEQLQKLGLIDVQFDQQLLNYLVSPSGEFRLLPSPPDCHVAYPAAVEQLRLRVAGCRDQRFRLRQPSLPREAENAVASDIQEVLPLASADPPTGGSSPTRMGQSQLKFSFE